MDKQMTWADALGVALGVPLGVAVVMLAFLLGMAACMAENNGHPRKPPEEKSGEQ